MNKDKIAFILCWVFIALVVALFIWSLKVAFVPKNFEGEPVILEFKSVIEKIDSVLQPQYTSKPETA